MKKVLLALTAVLAFALVATGCGGGGGSDEEEGRPAGGRQYQKAIESKAHGKYDQEYESMLSHHKESIADFHGTGHRMRKTGFAAVQHRRQSVVSY